METEFKVDKEDKERAEEIREMIKDGYHNLTGNGSSRPWIRHSSLVKYLKRNWNVSRQAVRNKLKEHGGMFQFRETENNEKVLRMRENADRFGQKQI